MSVKSKNTHGKNLSYQTDDPSPKTVPVVALVGGNGHLDRDGARVHIVGPTTAFGDVSVESARPYAQLKFTNGIIPAKMITTVSGSGTVTADASLLSVATGTTAGSIARLESTRMVRYAAGQGVEIKFTLMFPNAVAGANAAIGIGSAENALAIGVHGTSLAVLRRTGGQVEIQTLTVTTTPTGDGDLTITLNGGAGVTVAILNADTIGEVAQKIANADYSAEGGGWRAVYAGERVVFLAIETNARDGAYTFGAGVTGAVATFAQTAPAVAHVDNWTDSADFSIDKAAGAQALPLIDTAKLNVGRILYQWLGGGGIFFELEHPATGEWVTIHIIEYANAFTTPSVLHPDMPLFVESDNGLGTEDCIAQASSMGAFAHGELALTGPRVTATGSATVTTSQTPILAIRVKAVDLKSKTNTIRAFIKRISFGTESTKITTFQAHLNPTLIGDSISWTDADPLNSTVEISTNVSDFSGGQTPDSLSSGPAGMVVGSDEVLRAGDIWLVTAAVSNTPNAVVVATATWIEDV